MDYNEVILNLLEEKGMDKNIRENPEAAKQICQLFLEEVRNSSGKPIEQITENEMKQESKQILNQFDTLIKDGDKRIDSIFKINEDGSLNVKLKTVSDIIRNI